MALQLYNSLSRRVEEFRPLHAGKAALYTCGPTVYNFAHIGNFRAYLFEDILRRVLRLCGYEVTQVMNLTDVDDKTIRDSRAAGKPLEEFTEQYKQAFFADVDTVRIQHAEHYPAATDHIPEMIQLIATLIDKGYAYMGDDQSVYFSIAKWKSYGKLANIDLTQQRVGDRIRADEYGKEAVADFALWKRWTSQDGDVAWDSPWGKGRPGWHIECSAMSMRYLGNHFDIHTGGIDNLFPHHEDEIAQSEAATGETFANYWLHCAHLVVNGEKMSKSLGNVYSLRDLVAKGYHGREIRWLLIGSHYRQSLNFTFESLDAARAALERIDEFIRRVRELTTHSTKGEAHVKELIDAANQRFVAGLHDDLNVPVAMAAFFDFIKDINKAIATDAVSGAAAQAILEFCRRVDTVFGVIDVDVSRDSVPPAIQALVDKRLAARKNRDFAAADAIRAEIVNAGWQVEDTPKGARLVRVR